MIKIDSKNIDINLDTLDKFVSKLSNSQSIVVDDNNFSINCETLEVSAIPIIFNQVISNQGDFIWSVVDTNTAITTNMGYVAINDLTSINFIVNGIPINGDKLAFFNMGQGGFRVLKEGIIFGNKVTLVNGYLESLNYGDYIEMTYLNGKWIVKQSIGNINTL